MTMTVSLLPETAISAKATGVSVRMAVFSDP